MRSERTVNGVEGYTLRLYFNTTNGTTHTELTEREVEESLTVATQAFQNKLDTLLTRKEDAA